MIKKRISDIVNEAGEAPTLQEKVDILREYDNIAVRTYLKMAMDKNLKWLLPDVKPPYNPCQELDVEFVLYNELRRMYIFFPPENGGNPNITDGKRQQLFVTLLESMSPEDAEFLINVKDHKLPQGLNEQIIRMAYPGI